MLRRQSNTSIGSASIVRSGIRPTGEPLRQKPSRNTNTGAREVSVPIENKEHGAFDPSIHPTEAFEHLNQGIEIDGD